MPKRAAQSPVESPWWSSQQSAAYLGISVDSIYDAYAKKGLRGTKLGHRTLKFRREWLDEWAEKQARQNPAA